MEHKFCPECGRKLELDVLFCPNCGTKQPEQEEFINKTNELDKKRNQTLQTNQAKPNNIENSQFKSNHNYSYNNVNKSETSINKEYFDSNFYDKQTNSNDSADAYYHHNNNNSWHPYNQSITPGLSESFSVWIKSLTNLNQCMGRADFWWGYLAFVIIELLFWACFGVAYLTFANNSEALVIIFMIFRVVGAVFNVFSIIPAMERIQDTGHSKWNILWNLTGIGAIYVIYLLCQPTDWKEKRWVRING